MSIEMTQSMHKELDKFFAEKTIVDVDRNTFLICNLHDERYKLTISLVFMRDWDSIESDGYNTVILENRGAVFTLPCYWASVPKELAIPYIECIINDLYNTEISNWSCVSGTDFGNSGTGSSSTSGSGNCGCNPSKPIVPCPYGT